MTDKKSDPKPDTKPAAPPPEPSKVAAPLPTKVQGTEDGKSPRIEGVPKKGH
jgi:hypothetical protein